MQKGACSPHVTGVVEAAGLLSQLPNNTSQGLVVGGGSLNSASPSSVGGVGLCMAASLMIIYATLMMQRPPFDVYLDALYF